MVDWGTLSILTQAGTGFFVLLAGLVALASASPRRHTVSFASFLVLWGGFLLAGNFATLAVEAGQFVHGEELLILHAVLQGVAYLPLAVFTLSYPPSRRVELDRWPLVTALLVPAVAVLATVLVDPGLFHRGFTIVDGRPVSAWGPGKAGVLVVFRLAIYALLVRLAFVRERSTNDLERRQALYVLLGFSLFVGYESFQDLLLFSETIALNGLTLQSGIFAAISALGIGCLLLVAHRLLQGPRPLRATPRRLAVGCLAGSLGLGLLAGASFTWTILPEISAASVWRLGTVAFIMSAVTRFEHSDTQHPLPVSAAVLGWLSLTAAALVTMQLGLSALLGSPMYAFVALWGLLVAGASLVAWRRPGTFAELLRQIRRQRSRVGRARRDLELYEAALLSDSGDATLDDLRDGMSISPAEHEVMRRLTDPHTATPLPSEDPPEVGEVLDGRYELEAVLGEGSSSRVFQARDQATGEAVAVKLLDPRYAGSSQELRQFLHESRVCLRLDHPNIVEAYDLGQVEGQPYLSFELVEGGSLASRIPEDGLRVDEACQLVEGTLAGLEHLHHEGLVHRDVKPSNVLVDEQGRAKIGDLGLADTWDVERTQALGPEGGRLREGTPAYMSPEVLLGHPPSPRCDVYAAGAILVEALTGDHYLGLAGAPYATVKRAILETSPRLEGIDDELATICQRALHKDPGRRYASAAGMREAILDVVGPARETGYEMILSEIVEPDDGGLSSTSSAQPADGIASESV